MRRSNPVSTQRIVALEGSISAKLLPALTAQVAREELAKIQAVAPAPYRQWVDGQQGASLDGVKPGGVILFRFDRVGEVVEWLYTELRIDSPVGPEIYGHYRDDHWLFVGGARQSIDTTQRLQVAPGAEIVLANLRGYARKIELGSSLQAPDGVYQLATMAARKQFPGADISFTYRGFAGAMPITGKSANKSSLRYPCIVIKAAA